jgi:hypothetical protein
VAVPWGVIILTILISLALLRVGYTQMEIVYDRQRYYQQSEFYGAVRDLLLIILTLLLVGVLAVLAA